MLQLVLMTSSYRERNKIRLIGAPDTGCDFSGSGKILLRFGGSIELSVIASAFMLANVTDN